MPVYLSFQTDLTPITRDVVGSHRTSPVCYLHPESNRVVLSLQEDLTLGPAYLCPSAAVDMGISNHSCSQTIDLLSQPRGLNMRISPTP
jgi:hypothetical protein